VISPFDRKGGGVIGGSEDGKKRGQGAPKGEAHLKGTQVGTNRFTGKKSVIGRTDGAD